MDFEKFSARVRYVCRQEMDGVTDPEGDIEPRLFYFFEEGEFGSVTLPRVAFAGEDMKNLLVAALEFITRKITPDFLAFEATQYLAEYDMSQYGADERRMAIEGHVAPKGMVMPSEHPDRVEMVGVVAMDGERYLNHMAKIKRSAGPPVYGPWEELGVSTGRMVTPLQDVLREKRIAAGR